MKCVVAGSPPRFSYDAFSKVEEGPEFLARAQESQEQIDAGHPETLIETLYPFPLLVCRRGFHGQIRPPGEIQHFGAHPKRQSAVAGDDRNRRSPDH